MAKTKGWGFDTKTMDRKVRPQDDFYHYANGAWLKKNTIPPAEVRWGSFNILRHNTEKQLRAILADMQTTKAAVGSSEQLVRDMYSSAMDLKTRNKLGTTPLAPYLKEIGAIRDRKSLLATLCALHRLGVHAPWGFGVDQDSKDSSRYILHFYQSGLGMPDRDYYLKDGTEFARVRTAYKPFVVAMFRHLGRSANEAAAAAEAVLKVETELAKMSMDKVDARDAEKTYHKYPTAGLKKLAPLNWSSYFKDAGVPPVRSVIVMQPEFLKKSVALVDTLSLDEWKTYLTWQLMLYAGSHLSMPIARTNFNFYGKTLAGQKQMRAPWRRALSVTNSVVGFALGKIYIDKHFGSE
ncbi:MAG: M13 family metallopeptidase N-terminal domain-containing protein, partial [Patescibacteria group bacterium]